MLNTLKKLGFNALYSLIGPTLRLANDPWQKINSLKKEGRPLLFCLWHEFSAICFWFYRHTGTGILREDSAKGELLSSMTRRFGYRDFPVNENSTDRQTIKSTIQLIKYLREGHDGVIALDGPNGPYHQAKSGAFSIAQRANALVIPISTWCAKKIILKNRWDKYQVPLPFSSCAIAVGDPLQLPPKLDDASTKAELQKLIVAVDQQTVTAEKIGQK